MPSSRTRCPRISGVVSGALRGRIRAVREERGDSGQVIMIVIILVVLLSALGPVMASQITGEAPLVLLSTNRHAALAAAEAGIQWYRNHLDANPNYFLYTSSNLPSGGDEAMASGGWCSVDCDLGNTSPSEAFHYVPDDSNLFSTSGPNAGRVLLTVTGRAGSAGSFAYVSAQASFTASSILDNAYFSNSEVLDPGYPDEAQTTITASGEQSPQGITTYQVTYTVNGTSVTSSLWTALCGYQTYQPNNFIDWLGTSQSTKVDAEVATGNSTIGNNQTYSDVSQSYSASTPYYGPYYGTKGFSFRNGNGETVQVGGEACGHTFDFNTGETFTGPVYSNDQLHVCDTPTFSGSPISYTSGVSSNYVYSWDWLGATFANGNYRPAGYTTDPVQGFCGQQATPDFAHGSSLDGSEVLPTWNITGLATVAAAGGCLYTGPTMIALVTSASGTTTMNVWSPLSPTSGAGAPSAACRTGTSPSGAALTSFGSSSSGSTGPYITGIPLPANGVVYVQNAGQASSAPGVSDGLTGCMNPYVNLTQSTNKILPIVTASSATCLEGDTYIEGELHGELTVGSAANILITRDLTYACADGSSGPASATDPSSLSACTTASKPDVLGLEAYDDVLVSHPVSSPDTVAQMTGGAQTSNGLSTCRYDGTAKTVSTLSGGVASSVTNGEPNAVWPSCDITNPVVDAAVIALNGAFGVQYWNQGNSYSSNGVYLNGADISQYRGPFGLGFGSQVWGYDKEFSFDTRLQYLQPPYVLQSAVTTWRELEYVVCGNGNTATETTVSCPPVA